MEKHRRRRRSVGWRAGCRLVSFLPLLLTVPLGIAEVTAQSFEEVRQPAVAGTFYPADPESLRNLVDGLLAQSPAVGLTGPLVALVSPHAGYQYSGQVAAYAYALLKGRDVERVVVISPCHVDFFEGAAVFDGDGYATPLGVVPVDQAFCRKLSEQNSRIEYSGRGHRAARLGRLEHALEVQLPFLQRALGEFKLVPVVMGEQSYETCRALGFSLAKLIQDQKTLIVASTDLSHYHPYDEAVKLDQKVLTAIERWDYMSLSRNFQQRVWEACGGGPIIAAMMAAERLGARQASILKYANSGDVAPGDRNRVVGYAAVALAGAGPEMKQEQKKFQLSEAEKAWLLEIGKRSVETAVREGRSVQCSAAGFDTLQEERAAFVTLKKQGQLRGCIGGVAPVRPLFAAVRESAAAAALQDPRFRPVTADELAELEYEISVLSPIRKVLDINEIRVGEHGLIVRKGRREGLLLPQVAVEQGWDRETFIEQACWKAGLPPHAWKDPETDLFLFTAIVFGDRH